MASQHPIVANQIVFVLGQVRYSGIGSVIQGERLQRMNANSHSNYPMGPHTRLELNNPKIYTPKGQQVSETALYIQDHFFQGKDGVLRTTLVSRAYDPAHYQLPWIAVVKKHAAGAPEHAVQYRLKNHEELAAGQEVIAVMRSFESRKFHKAGLSLQGVITQENANDAPKVITYSSNVQNTLSQLGIILDDATGQENPQPSANVNARDLPQGLTMSQNQQAAPQQAQPQMQQTQAAPVQQTQPANNAPQQGAANSDPTPSTNGAQNFFNVN